MKFRNIIAVALASSLVFAACTKEEATDSFENIKLDKTYLSIDPNGGSASVKISATEDWHLNAPDATGWDKSSTWVTPSDTVGVAGEAVLTFTAEANVGREVNLTITCGNNTQNLVIRQGDLTPTKATCAEILSGSVPQGKTVIVTGTCTNIYNTTYGNWYLNDGTGEITIYGTLYKGKTKQFTSLGIEAGDVVTVQGPYTLYGTTHELTDVTVLNITKALAKVESKSHDVAKEGETFDVKVSFKGKTLDPAVPEAYQDWISIISVTTKSGVPTKIETNPADTAYVKVKVAPNEGGDREGQINFTSSTTDVSYAFTQKGAIIDASVAEFLAAAESNTQYRVTGVVTKISASSKYHNADITVSSGDFASSVLLYRTVTSEGNIEDKGIKVGDIVTVLGKRSSYNNTPQMAAGGVCESVKSYAAATVAEFLAAENGSEYAVTGEITKVASLSGKSGYNNVNITIKDGDNTLYLYRVTTYDKADVAALNPEVGGTITVAGKRGEYNGSAQMAAGGVVLAYTAPAAVSGATYTLTADGLPTAYPTEETTVTLSGLECYILNVANYGSGIQLKKGGAYIANKTALKKIKTIKVTCPDGKKYYPDNVSLYAGSAAKPEGTAITGTSDDNSTTFDLSSGNYTFFTIKNASSYAVNFSKIEITCEN